MPKNNLSYNNFKKYVPFIFLAILTIALMFYFKEKKGDFGELVREGKEDLLQLYTQNLKPLLFETDITNADVFNFALYQTLPVDKKKNKVIQIKDEQGKGSLYEVHPISYKLGDKSYNNFVDYLELDNQQKTKLDSTLDSYKDELAEAVLVNDDSTIAVNTRLADLQKAILTSIASFAQKIKNKNVSKVFPPQLSLGDPALVEDLVNEIKQDTSHEYIVFANDTAFASRFHFNNRLLTKSIDSLRKNIASVNKEKMANLNFRINPKVEPYPKDLPSMKEFKVNKDTSNIIVFAPFSDGYLKDKKDYDTLKKRLAKINERIQNIAVSITTDSINNKFKLDLHDVNDSLRNFHFEMDMNKLNELIKQSMQMMNTSQEERVKLSRKIDSLKKEVIKMKGDSTLLRKMKKKDYKFNWQR